jgi:hypothetical protein
MRDGLLDILRHASVQEQRAAVVWGLWWFGDRKGEGDEVCIPALVEAIRAETSAVVVGAIGGLMACYIPPPEACDAFRESLSRLPLGPERRAVCEALARGTFLTDGGAELVRRFEETGEQGLRDDLAAGLARAGISMSGVAGRDQRPEDRDARQMASRDGLLTVYRGCSDLTVRRRLARGVPTGFGFNWFDSAREELRPMAAQVYQAMADLEPDPEFRDRLRQVAAAIEDGEVKGTDELERILGSH